MAPAATITYIRSMRRLAPVLLLTISSAATAELLVSGVNDELARNVRAYVELVDEPCDAEPWRVRRRYREAVEQARKALEPFGYYDPVIASELVFSESCWQARLDIDPGQPVLVRDVDVGVTGPGKDDPEFSKLLASGTPKTGTQLRHADYDALKESLQVVAIERGYVEAEFTAARMDIWPEQKSADISLNYTSGPRYELGDISQEQAFLDPALVAAYMDLQPGTPYSSASVSKAYRDLANSGYFSRIDLTPDFSSAQNRRIPLRVTLEPAARIEYTVGAGFATDTGPRLRAGYRNRRVNRRGHRLNAELRLSPVLSGIAAEYRIPLRDPRSEWTSYTAAIDSEDTDTFDSDSVRVGYRRSRKLTRAWLRTLSIDVNYDSYTVGDVDDNSLLVLPGLTFDQKKANRDLYPTRGRRLGVSIRGTDTFLGSTTTFVQILAQIRLVRQLGESGRLLARTQFGFTAKDEFNELPPSVRFFAGGDDSVRGFGYQSLGPTDDDGNVIGGSHLLVGSIEYEHQLRGNVYGAVFIDAGNAFDTLDVDAAIGTGIGIKWRSPVGPLRFYLAHPLNTIDRDIRVHISIGADL